MIRVYSGDSINSYITHITDYDTGTGWIVNDDGSVTVFNGDQAVAQFRAYERIELIETSAENPAEEKEQLPA